MVALATLAAAKVELAPGASDLRGWEVRTLVDDRTAGRVRDLLLDEAGQVRWLALELAGGRHVLLPSGQARAQRERRRIWIPGLAADQLALLPDYALAAGPPDAGQEAALLAAYDAALLREHATPLARPAAGVPGAAGHPDARAPRGDPRLDGSALFGQEPA